MAMPALTAAPPVTLAEFAALPEWPRYELVKGELVELMSVCREHEETVARVIRHLGNYIDLLDPGEVYGSNRAFVTGPNSPASSRMPDVSFVSHARLGRPDLHGMLYDGAPDLAVEVVSPGNSAAEMEQKVREYLAAGGQAVWVLDYTARTLTVHTGDAPPAVLTDDDIVDGGAYLPGFVCPVSDLMPRPRP